jgi:hypothetical protein
MLSREALPDFYARLSREASCTTLADIAHATRPSPLGRRYTAFDAFAGGITEKSRVLKLLFRIAEIELHPPARETQTTS